LLLLLAGAAADPPGWQVLFREDFEHGDGAWSVSGNTPSTPLWAIENDGGNFVYSASSRTFALANAGPWRDFRLRLRLRMLSGTFHLNFRHMQCGRYFVGIGSGALSLVRMLGCYNHSNLLVIPPGISYGRWYAIDVLAVGATVKFYLDGNLALEYTDPTPVLLGTIGLEVGEDTHVQVDDIVVTGPVDTQTLSWVRTGGPHGGVGYDIRMRPDNPDDLMVTDNRSGVSISTDGGGTWKPSNEGIRSRAGSSGDAIPVFCLTIDPINPNIVWAGTQNMRGMYRSTDGGRTWVQKDRGVVEKNGITFRGFTVDPRDSKTVYAAAEISSSVWAGQPRTGQMFDLVRGVVYKTTDGGEKAGHHIPTDHPARNILLVISATDAQGRALPLLAGPRVPDWGGEGSEPTDYAGRPGRGYAKILEELWTEIAPTAAYWNPTVLREDTRLAALATDISEYEFRVPPEGGMVKVEARLIFRRAFKSLDRMKRWEDPDIQMEQAAVTVAIAAR